MPHAKAPQAAPSLLLPKRPLHRRRVRAVFNNSSGFRSNEREIRAQIEREQEMHEKFVGDDDVPFAGTEDVYADASVHMAHHLI